MLLLLEWVSIGRSSCVMRSLLITRRWQYVPLCCEAPSAITNYVPRAVTAFDSFAANKLSATLMMKHRVPGYDAEWFLSRSSRFCVVSIAVKPFSSWFDLFTENRFLTCKCKLILNINIRQLQNGTDLLKTNVVTFCKHLYTIYTNKQHVESTFNNSSTSLHNSTYGYCNTIFQDIALRDIMKVKSAHICLSKEVPKSLRFSYSVS